ncbi:hypothetical protein DFS34DRAFT_658835 [Phlyctochytrium arcticum]|nr:hypothetical protein DFS34DRAFT_658835 [Phlyctochytrium arcticum]
MTIYTLVTCRKSDSKRDLQSLVFKVHKSAGEGNRDHQKCSSSQEPWFRYVGLSANVGCFVVNVPPFLVVGDQENLADDIPDWLEDFYEELPYRIKERISSVYEDYLEKRIDSEQDHFVLTCGRPGTKKSSLINALIGEKDLLFTSCGIQTSTLVPTRVRRGAADDQSWSFRVVFRNADQWGERQQEAIVQLWVTVDTGPISEEDTEHDTEEDEHGEETHEGENVIPNNKECRAILDLLSAERSINILRAAHPELNIKCHETMKRLGQEILGTTSDPQNWTEASAVSIRRKATQEAPQLPEGLETLPNNLSGSDCGLERYFTGLEKQHVQFLLEHLCQSHTSNMEVAKYLLSRHLLINPETPLAGLEGLWRDIWKLQNTEEDQDIEVDSIEVFEALRIAQELGYRMQTKGCRLDMPTKFLNLWPIVEFIEIAGPVNLPPRIVLVDSAGAQDDQHLVDPVVAALDSLGRPPTRVWHTCSTRRTLTDSTAIAESVSIGRQVGWPTLAIVFTACDEGNVSELGATGSNILQRRTRLKEKLLSFHDKDDARKMSEDITIRESSAHFYWAFLRKDEGFGMLHEDVRKAWKIDEKYLKFADSKQKKIDNMGLWSGVFQLRSDLQTLLIEERSCAKALQEKHAKRLLLHLKSAYGTDLDQTSEGDEDEEMLDLTFQRDPIAYVLQQLRFLFKACQNEANGMQMWEELPSYEVNSDGIGSLTDDEIKDVRQAITVNLRTMQPEGLSPLEDAHHTHFKGLLKYHGKLIANSTRGPKRYHVAYVTGTLFAECVAIERHLDKPQKEICNQVKKCFEEIESLIESGLVQLKERLSQLESEESVAADIKRQIETFRKLLKHEIMALLDNNEINSLCSSPSSFAVELWRQTAYREVWNDIWQQSRNLLPTRGKLAEKLDVLVANIAQIAPRKLEGVLKRILSSHLRSQRDTMYGYVKKGMRQVCERLVQATQPLKLTVEESVCVNWFETRVCNILEGGDITPRGRYQTQHALDRKRVNQTNDHDVGSDSKRVKRLQGSDGTVCVEPMGMTPSTTPREKDGDPTTYHDLNGTRFCVFFRGLCATQQSEVFRSPTDSASSALVGELDDIFRNPVYQAVSSFVVAEDMLRAQTGALYGARDLKDRVAELAGELCEEITTVSQRTFSGITEDLNVKTSECKSKSLAFFATPREFENIMYAAQQVYSNNEVKFMQSYADTAADVSKHAAPLCEPNLAALVDRAEAVKAKASNKARWQYLRNEAWRWMGNPKYLLPRHELASSLHGNPYVSITDNLTHALRYTCGLKKYRQGKHEQPARSLSYGWDPVTKMYRKDLWRKPGTKETSLVGVLLLFLIPYEYYEARRSSGSCNNVTLLEGSDKMNIGPRIKSEREVTFLAHVPQESLKRSWEMPMLDLDDAASWSKYYGLTRSDEPFTTLETSIKELVTARVDGVRAQGQHVAIVQNKENNVRRALKACLLFKLRLDFEKPGESLPNLETILDCFFPSW